jgi:crotonobetainyl-CoA:carnitine CoA-transferase CaiB-like acyl-CoA transferase
VSATRRVPPLEGVRVVEVGGGVAAAFCARLLADCGADVVKVENPRRGDGTRSSGPFAGGRPHIDTGALFLALNGGKRSVALDLKTASGNALLMRLVDGADVVITGLRPASLDRIGLGGGAVQARNPRAVHVALTSFGLSGPMRDAPASELTLCCAGGLAYVTGEYSDPPTKSALDQAQYIGGSHAAGGALAALWHAERTGQGQLVEVSIQEVVAGILQGKLSYYTYMGCVARRQPKSSGSLQYALLPCRDGYIAPMFVPGANVDWELFATFLELPELMDERFATRAGRIENGAELEQIITARLAEKGKYEWFHSAQEWRLTFGVVQSPEELLRCPQLEARGYWSEVDHPVAGPLRIPGQMFRSTEDCERLPQPAPRLGEHTAAVLGELGVSAGDVLALQASSAVRSQELTPPGRGADPPRAVTSAATPSGDGALHGVRVIECGEAYAVPHLTRLLADMGADVIKVESCYRPDVVRVWPFPDNVPGEQFWNRGGVFNEPNRNKRAVTIDLRTPKGVEVFKRLIATADVFCENYTPRVMSQLGLDYKQLVAVKPDLIMLSSTGYGHGGPWMHYTAWGFTVEPTAGVSHFVGRPDGPPLRTGIAYVDMPAASVSAVAVLAALRYHRRTGRGQWIDLAQYEVGAGFIGEALVAAAIGARPQTRTGNRHRSHAPQGVYPCAGTDRWVALTVSSDRQFTALCDLIGAPELAADASLRTAEGRGARHAAVDAALSAWTSSRSAEDVATRLRESGIAAMVAMTVKDLLLDEHLRERGYFELATHRPETGDLGTRPYPGMAVRLHATPGGIRCAAPLLGQDNDEVFAELGYDAGQRAELESEGVSGRWPVRERIDAIGQHVVPYASLTGAGLIEGRDADFMERLGLRTAPLVAS